MKGSARRALGRSSTDHTCLTHALALHVIEAPPRSSAAVALRAARSRRRPPRSGSRGRQPTCSHTGNSCAQSGLAASPSLEQLPLGSSSCARAGRRAPPSRCRALRTPPRARSRRASRSRSAPMCRPRPPHESHTPTQRVTRLHRPTSPPAPRRQELGISHGLKRFRRRQWNLHHGDPKLRAHAGAQRLWAPGVSAAGHEQAAVDASRS